MPAELRLRTSRGAEGPRGVAWDSFLKQGTCRWDLTGGPGDGNSQERGARQRCQGVNGTLGSSEGGLCQGRGHRLGRWQRAGALC